MAERCLLIETCNPTGSQIEVRLHAVNILDGWATSTLPTHTIVSNSGIGYFPLIEFDRLIPVLEALDAKDVLLEEVSPLSVLIKPLGSKLNTASNLATVIRGLDPTTFPVLGTPSSNYLMDIPGNLFKQAVDLANQVIKPNDTYQTFNCLQVTIDPAKGFLFEAIDSKDRRMLIHEASFPAIMTNVTSSGTFFLDHAKLSRFAKFAGASAGMIEVFEEPHEIQLVHGAFCVGFRKTNGSFPNCKTLVPQTFSFEGSVSRSRFTSLLQMASALSDNSSQTVELVSDSANSLLSFDMKSKNGMVQEKLFFQPTTSSTELNGSFRVSHLLDGLKMSGESTVTFKLIGPGAMIIEHLPADAVIQYMTPAIQKS